MSRRRTTATHLLTLALAFAVLYSVGLDNYGVTNWQEGIRLLTARDMALRGEWVVPTVHGEPYLAKPPLIYWGTLAAAEARSWFTGTSLPTLFDLRLVVAIAGVLGVLATYLAGLVLLDPKTNATEDDRPRHPVADHPPHRAAYWAAWLAGTGVLFTRSARTGALDVLLIPTVTACIAAGAYAVLTPARLRARALAAGLAVLLASLAALVKGPAGLLVIACALPGGALLDLAFGTTPRLDRLRRALLALGLSLLCALAAVGTLTLWARGVAQRIGQDAVDRAVRTETGENLRLFDDDAWLRFLEALAYGGGLGSLLMLAALARLISRRPPARLPITPGLWMLLGFLGLSYLAFSLTTKGVPRYLTPVWPSLALLGAWWLVQRIEETRDLPRRYPGEFCAVVTAGTAIGLSLWYAYGRDRFHPHGSPRALARELQSMSTHPIDPERLGAFDLWTPALEIELGATVTPWAGPADTSDVPHTTPGRIEALAERLRGEFDADPSAGPYTLFVRTIPDKGREAFGTATEQLEALGLEVTPIETEAEWRTDNGRSPVIPVHVRASRPD